VSEGNFAWTSAAANDGCERGGVVGVSEGASGDSVVGFEVG